MRRGFTLLEVIVAMSLLALLLTLIQGAYSGAVRSRNRAQAETGQLHAAAVVLDRLAGELSSAYAEPPNSAAPETMRSWLILEPGSDELAALSFTSRLNPVQGGMVGEPAEVEYRVEADEDGVLRLMRRETRDVDDDPEEGGRFYELFRGVSRFQVLVFDGEEWVEAWDSRNLTSPPFLPTMAQVEIAWTGDGTEEEEETILRTWAPLYGI